MPSRTPERINPGWLLVEMFHIYVLFNPFKFVRALFKKKKKKTIKLPKRGRLDHTENHSILTTTRKLPNQNLLHTSNIVYEHQAHKCEIFYLP